MPKSNAQRSAAWHPPKGAGVEPLGTTVVVRGKLALLGWPSVAAWARAHGYLPVMADHTIRVWGNRVDRTPLGGISRALMRDLRSTIATEERAEPESPAIALAQVASNERPAKTEFGRRLIEVIGSESVSSFGRRCGIGEATIRSYLKGADPSRARLVAMAEAGNVSIEWLATGREG